MKKIIIISGEVSGDKHGARLMRALKREDASLQFHGIGGDEMIAEGLDAFEHNKNMAFLGLIEVVRHLGFIRNKIKQIEKFIQTTPVKAVILIDYPGFNLKIASISKKHNIPVIYYICPQIWAWGKHRVNKIRKWVDLPLVILPFEEDFYRSHHIKAKFVGHPSLESIHTDFDGNAFRAKYELNEKKKLIGLFPGSRRMEVESLLPVMIKTAEILSKQFPNITFALSKTKNLPLNLYKKFFHGSSLNMVIIEDHPYDLMKHSYLAMVASGTASLEMAIFNTPAVVLYKVNSLTYHIGKLLVNVPFLSLTNLILEEEVFPEFLQHDCNPDKISQTLGNWLSHEWVRNEVVQKTGKLNHILGDGSASHIAAESIIQFLQR